MANEFVHGNNRITVDIVDRTENLVGPGDIRTCLGVEYTEVLNDAGPWSARFPANDPIIDRIQLKRHFLDFYIDGEFFFRGLTEKWNWQLNNDGQIILVLSGRDLLVELDETTVDFLLMSGGADPEPTLDAPAFIINNYNDAVTGYSGGVYTWFCAPVPQTETYVYSKTAGETALSIFRRVAEQTGESFRLMAFSNPAWANRTIEWLQTDTPASGVRAIGGTGDSVAAENNPFVCFIQDLTERRDASRMIVKIIPFGAGLGETRLDLVGTSRSAPAGFTYNAADNSITNDAALAYVGKLISRHVNFKDIRPLFNTDADIQYAKDFLFDAALAYLQRNDDIDDTLEYDLDVIALPSFAQVGMTLRVVWQDERRDIDTDFVILAIRKVVGSDGGITYGLTVATRNQWRFRETHNIIAEMEQGEIFHGHPQIDANAYWMAFREEVGDNQTLHMAEFPFWLSAEVVTIRQVLFRCKVDQALIGVKTYAYAASDTNLNVAANTGNESAALTSGVNGAVPTGTAFPSVTQAAVPDETDGVFGSIPTDGVNLLSTTNGPTQTTGVISLPAFDTGQNDIAYGGWETGAALPDATTGDGSIAGDPHTHDFAHTHSHTHMHPAILPDHVHGTDHEHEHEHVHNFAHHHEFAHEHGIVHDHPMPHQHAFPHTHPSPQHIHGLPALVATFNMERIPALNSYVIGDLEFAVNGGGWASLSTAIPVAGGYSEVDITSHIQDPAGLKRPYQDRNEYHVVQVRRSIAAGTGKMAMVRAQIGIRQTVQSVVLYE